MSKTLPFSMRLEEDLKAALQRFADKDRRSLTNYIEAILHDHVAEREKREAKRK